MSAAPAIIAELACMPDRFEQSFSLVPQAYRHWVPQSWEGVPGEMFSALEQACHLRDIEIDGYQMRIRRLLEEENPVLVSIDGYALARQRRYSDADPGDVLAEFRTARNATIQLVQGITDSQMMRQGCFDGYGRITLRGLIHFLCSHDQQHLACMQWLLGKIESHSTFGAEAAV